MRQVPGEQLAALATAEDERFELCRCSHAFLQVRRCFLSTVTSSRHLTDADSYGRVSELAHRGYSSRADSLDGNAAARREHRETFAEEEPRAVRAGFRCPNRDPYRVSDLGYRPPFDVAPDDGGPIVSRER